MNTVNHGEGAGKTPALNLSGRIPELDGIRGIAIGMILVFHCVLLIIQVRPGSALAYVLASGRLAWSGVDLFFVLSGFLIGGILLDARNSSNYFKVFYTRRFFRIVPIYAVFLCCFSAFLLVIRAGWAPAFADVPKGDIPLWSYPLFLQNFWMAAHNTRGMIALSATWSLAIEEQFYLTLPAIIRFLEPRRLLQVVVGGIVGAPLLRFCLHYFWLDSSMAQAVLMVCRADALLLGAFGAILLRSDLYRGWLEKNYRYLQILLLVLACGTARLTIKHYNESGYLMSTLGYSWLAAFYLSIILCALLRRHSLLSAFLRTKWLGWLGTIAYGTYLLHTPILLVFSRPFWPKPLETTHFSDLWVSLAALIITLGLCRLSWLYFEKPLVKIGHRQSYLFGASEPAAVTVTATAAWIKKGV